MYEIRTLEQISFAELTAAHNAAFADYVTPLHFTPKGMEAYFKVSGVDRRFSCGAFYEDQLVGMLANGVDNFCGKTVAYDALTGIVPEHRDKGLFSKLFEHARIKLKNNNIRHYYIEVITTNTKAYSVYQRIGAQVQREFAFLAGTINSACYQDGVVSIAPLATFPLAEQACYQPSFGNRVSAMRRDPDNYLVARTISAPEGAAVIFGKQGRVMQIRYRGAQDDVALRAIFTCLSGNFAELRISNIPLTENGLIQQLLNMGLTILANQYELCLGL